MKKIKLHSLAAVCLLIVPGCLFFNKIVIRGNGNIKLEQVHFSSLDNWDKDEHKLALQSFLHSCRKFANMAQNRQIGGQIGNITAGDFHDVCEIAEVVKSMSSSQARNFFENWFKPFLVKTRYGNSKGVFTGYYEASLSGSKVKTETYKYPIYAKPKDLEGDPYFTRQEIENGALENKGLELLYVDNKVDLFFMHIQGSGRIKMPGGSEVRVAYAARNNHPFTAVGNYMVDHQMLEPTNLNAATVRQWLKDNPDRADSVMNINNAYIFFKIQNGEYVTGAQGVPLTAEHSLAVDSELMPYGLPIWVNTTLKNRDGTREKYQKLFIAQDTGSAIKGTVRGDIFFGYGKEAEEKASYMASQGNYYILLPINVVDKMKGSAL